MLFTIYWWQTENEQKKTILLARKRGIIQTTKNKIITLTQAN